MLLLALDTSGAGVTVALHDGSRVVAERSSDRARRHAEQLAPFIAAVLDDVGALRTDVTDIAVGVGPGPFTGLRAGIVTARVLGLALGVAVHGFCSLDALAQSVVGDLDGEFLVATDARRREVYWARYRAEGGLAVRLAGPQVDTPAALRRDGLPVVGTGAALYPEMLGPTGTASDSPGSSGALRAGALAVLAVQRLAAGQGPFPDEPLYLRRPDAAEPGARKRVLSPSE